MICDTTMKVLLTDGNFKHTLAAVRSLGKRGIDVTVLSHLSVSISFYSKYCRHHVIAPNPENDPRFADFLLEYVKKNQFDVLLPVSFAAVMPVSRIRDELEKYVKIPLADDAALGIAGSKDRTIQYAEKIGVGIPKTWYPKTESDVDKIAHEVSYPAVIKGSEESGFVRYANSPEELAEKYRMIARYSPVIQEYITGEGYGFFALYNHGKAPAMFMHKRIREYPVTGGPSAVAESVYDPALRDAGLHILDSLSWHGVAMVEFKKDQKTGEFVLMEINPKFWGSLGLSIVSGVDFPYLACRMVTDGDIEPVNHYETGVKYRWLFPSDIFHVMTNPCMLPQFIRDFGDRSFHYDLDIHDPFPSILQVGMTFAEFLLRVNQKRFWRPHGRPHC
ncbi:MAG: ATP-grasp domain-containing protein [Methanoregula sp.]|jgi:predicted ATP-grasp superfamily ATP-dependent carboligase